MWHYLMFCSINDSAIQLGSVAGITPLSSPPPLQPTPEHGGLSSKVKCQTRSIPTYREGPGATLGAQGALLLSC